MKTNDAASATDVFCSDRRDPGFSQIQKQNFNNVYTCLSRQTYLRTNIHYVFITFKLSPRASAALLAIYASCHG